MLVLPTWPLSYTPACCPLMLSTWSRSACLLLPTSDQLWSSWQIILFSASRESMRQKLRRKLQPCVAVAPGGRGRKVKVEKLPRLQCAEVTDYSAVFLQEEVFLCDECLEQEHMDCELGEKICPTCKSLGERLRSRWLRQKGITKVKGDLLSEGRCRWSTWASRRSPEGS